MDDRKSTIRSFLSNYMNADDLEDDEDIFATGFVDSMFAMQLVQFLETEFDLTVEDQDLRLENFNTIANMAQFVEEKKASSVPSS
jgi:acyl carrier protein